MEDSATDGFFVPDGQLSDDEGISSAQQGVDDLLADQGCTLSSSGKLSCIHAVWLWKQAQLGLWTVQYAFAFIIAFCLPCLSNQSTSPE